MAQQTTPLSALLEQPPQMMQQPGPPQQQPQQNPSGQFNQLPTQGGGMINSKPITNQQPMGQGQGLTMPEGNRREFFGFVKDCLVNIGFKIGLIAE